MRNEQGDGEFGLLLIVITLVLVIVGSIVTVVQQNTAHTKYTTICTVIQTGPNSYKAETADSGSYHFNVHLSDTAAANLYQQLLGSAPGTFRITWYHNFLGLGGNALSKASLLPAKQQRKDLCPKR